MGGGCPDPLVTGPTPPPHKILRKFMKNCNGVLNLEVYVSIWGCIQLQDPKNGSGRYQSNPVARNRNKIVTLCAYEIRHYSNENVGKSQRERASIDHPFQGGAFQFLMRVTLPPQFHCPYPNHHDDHRLILGEHTMYVECMYVHVYICAPIHTIKITESAQHMNTCVQLRQ